MFIDCRCGARNSAFNPACVACGAAIVEGTGPTSRSAPSSGPLDLDIAAEVGGYRLLRTLGSGMLGRVYMAQAPGGEPVALKVLHPHLMVSDDARARFVREARALRELRHASIGALLDAFEIGGVPVLVLELVPGISMRARLDTKGPMPAVFARVALRQLTEALHAIHAAGWVHRDVKPENVMLVSDEPEAPVTKLLDFGLARALAPSSNDMRTAAGVFVGSLAYAAPEQILTTDVGPTADPW